MSELGSDLMGSSRKEPDINGRILAVKLPRFVHKLTPLASRNLRIMDGHFVDPLVFDKIVYKRS